MANPKKSKAARTESAKADKPVHLAPVVNLSSAAQSAALLLAARRKKAADADDTAGHVNAAAFKKIKDGGSNLPSGGSSPLLAGLNKPAKPTGSAGYNQAGGHHQKSGANVARTGVPRRTSGG